MTDNKIKEKMLSELEIDEASLNAIPIPETVVKKKTELVGHFAAIDETVKIDDGEFSVKFIESDGNETMIYINPDEHKQLFIHMDEKYKLICEEKNGHVYAKKVCPRKPTNTQERQKHAEKLDNIAKICSFDDVPLPLMLDHRRDKRVLLELYIEGKAKQLEDTDNTTKFVLSTDKRNFECVIVNNLMLPNVPLKLEENVSYLFRGYLASDGIFYVTGSDKEYTMELVYTNIPKELISDFRQLTLRQKEEILNLYEFYTHPDKKVEVLPQVNFVSIEGYTLKFKLLRKFIPVSLSALIEKKIADQTKNNRHHKIEILKSLLDTVYPATREKRNISESMTRFRKTYFGHEREAHRIFNLFNNNYGGCYCVVGESTDFFVKSSLDACGIDYTKIDANTIENLVGTPYIYENATLGELIKNISSMQTVVIPNIDKITSETKNMDPLSPIYQLLNSGVLIDSMVGEAVNLFDLGIKIFVTFSDVSRFSKKLLAKMNTIYLPDFSEEERKIICEKYMIPEKLKALPDGTKVHFDEDAYNKIANQFTIGQGLYEVEANLNKIFDAIEDQHTGINGRNIIDLLGMRQWNNEYAKDLLSLKEKFMCNKYLYEQERRQHISMLFKFYDEAVSLERREELLNQLRILVNILPSNHHFSNVDLEKVEQKMNETTYNMEKAKKHILNTFALRKVASTEKIAPLLLYGPCGVGKTSIAMAFSEQCPVIVIPCQGLTRRKFVHAVAEKLSEACTSNALIVLEEIEKASKTDCPMHSIQSVIDGFLCIDEINCNIDVSGVLVLATTNCIEDISPALLSRYDIITVDGYSMPEKRHITKNYMLPKLLKTFNVGNLDFTEEAIDELILYSPEVGMRDVEKHLTNILGTLLRKGGKTNIVAPQDIREILGEKPLFDGAPEGDFGPGTVKGMAVCGNHRGVSMPISVTENTFGDKDEVVGLAGESVLESVKVSKLLCERIINKKLPCLFIEFGGDLSVKKEGSSGGLAVFVAMLSFALQQTVPSEYAFTGELSSVNGGNVQPVGVKEKIKAAISDKGTTKIYIPYDNYVQETGNLEKYDIDIVPVRHINEIVNDLFKLGGNKNDD